ncbi:MAG: hypothetical protein JRI55_35900, partial [Deltaproteobacteria bacterium]|jgi:hypothetical protein|nr:hypothetical protein [Deltaproteobacteria bacterium]
VAAGASDLQLPLLAFVRRPEQLGDWFAELAERWAGVRAELADPGGAP